ncbi:choline/carnitine O-acyltransferase [Endozoicomonas sp. SCSIO W0465]|nr:choline/carnitine O-acyltransferase [Endozoicomonas sp. SCSIO W0465]
MVKRSTLSTSSVADPNIGRFVFGPVVSEGLGVAYSPAKSSLNVTVSWQKDNRGKALKFVARLEKSVNQLLEMLNITGQHPGIAATLSG